MNKFDLISAKNHVKTDIMVTNIIKYMEINKITFKKMSFDMNIPESTLKSAVAKNYSAISTLENICKFYKITLPNFDNFNYGAYCGKEQAIIDLTNYLNFTLYQLSMNYISKEEFHNYFILIAYEFLFNNRVYIPSSIRRKSKFIDINKKLIKANQNIRNAIENVLKQKGLNLNSDTYQSRANAPLNRYDVSYNVPLCSYESQESDINNTLNMIGNSLHNIKKESGLTLDQFGNIFSLDGSTIKNIEAGRYILKYDYVKWIYALFDNVNIDTLITNEQASLNKNYDFAYESIAASLPKLSAFRTNYQNKVIDTMHFLVLEPTFIQDYERLEVFLAIISTGFKANKEFLFESFNYPDVKLNTKDIEWLNTEIKKAVKTEYKDDLTRKYTKICFKEFYHYDEDKSQITLTDDKLMSIIEKLQEPKRP